MKISFTKIQGVVAVGAITCSFLFALCAVPTTSHAAITQKSGTTTTGLMGWWMFDEGTSTTANDFSISRNMGTLVNSPVWTTGKRGRSLLFNGSNTQVNVAETNLNPSTITVSAWVKLSGNQTSRVFIAKYFQSPTRGWGIGIDDSTANVIKWYTSTESGTSNTLNSTFALTNGLWYHVVGTFDGTTKRLYINGVENNNVTWSNSIGYTSTVTGIGYLRFTGTQYFNGSIDDVKVYNSALSATDVLTLYRAGEVVRKAADKTGLVGYWPMDEATSTTVGDFSGRSYTGTLSGASIPTWVNGKKGKALSFDNNRNYVETNQVSAFNMGTQNFTLAAFVKKNNNTARVIFEKRGSGLLGYLFVLDYPSAGQAAIFLNDPIGGQDVYTFSSPGSMLVDTWFHAAVTVNRVNNTATFYNNGIAMQTVSIVATTGSIDGDGTLKIGYDLGGFSFNGSMDDARIYSRALSGDEMAVIAKSNQTKVNAPQDTKITSGLVSYWTFNGKDVGTTIADVSGQNNPGYVVGAATSTVLGIGKVGQALSLDGISNYVIAPKPASLTGVISVCLWARWTTLTGGIGNIQMLVDNNHNGGSIGFVMQDRPDLSQRLTFSTNPSGSGVQSTGVVGNGTWKHICGTNDGATSRMYVDGVLDASTAEVPDGAYQTFISLGKWQSGSRYFRGNLDEVRIYNRAITATEVKQLYLMGK